MPCDPEGYEGKYNFPRRYLVSTSLVRWDRENVIAVRVYNGGDPGGIFGGPVKLRMATLDFVQQLLLGHFNGRGGLGAAPEACNGQHKE